MTPRQRKQKRSLFLRRVAWGGPMRSMSGPVAMLTRAELRVHPFSRRSSFRKGRRLLKHLFGI